MMRTQRVYRHLSLWEIPKLEVNPRVFLLNAFHDPVGTRKTKEAILWLLGCAKRVVCFEMTLEPVIEQRAWPTLIAFEREAVPPVSLEAAACCLCGGIMSANPVHRGWLMQV